MACLDEQTLWAHLRRELSDEAEEGVQVHLDGCDACRRLVAAAVRAGAITDESGEAGNAEPLPIRFLPQGTLVGRFVVLHRLGAGAMGVVYAAYDPQLDRRLALKFLYDESSSRLLDEARALARLSHPHVTVVHDVGVYGLHPFLALEFIPGMTLGMWRRALPRSLDEKLDLLRQAGRGLAAAHAAGLAHRDFKPGNVLVAGQRAWVTDFGLGGPLVAEAQAALVGTPAYMAPEQLDGRLGDARSDQFSFCVTAWELLFGARPFDGDSLPQLKASQQVTPTTPSRDVPARLVEALQRGLARDPSLRHPTMEHLLAALEPARHRPRWLLAAAALVLVTFGVGWLERPQPDGCANAEDEVAGVWTAATPVALTTAFEASSVSSRPALLAELSKRLEDYHRALRSDYRAACTRFVQHHDDERLYQRRRACLHQRSSTLRAVISSLSNPSGWTSETSSHVVATLPSLGACQTLEIAALPPLPDDPAEREHVLQLQARLSQFEARWSMQEYRGQLEGLEALSAEVRRVGFAPLLGEVLRVQGRWEFTMADYDGARATLREAGLVALGAGHDVHAIHAWNSLSNLDATRLGLLDEARHYNALAVALAERPTVDEWTRVQVLFRTGVLRLADDDPHGAVTLLEEAIRRGRRNHSTEGALAGAITTLARAERELGRPSRSAVLLYDLIEKLEGQPELGPARGTDARYELALTLMALGRLGEAEDELTRVHRTFATIYGESHLRTAEA
ncbi:MAG: protein kinase, partial [Archangium sp.]|nr:protein kinase [Archangium sp.]